MARYGSSLVGADVGSLLEAALGRSTVCLFPLVVPVGAERRMLLVGVAREVAQRSRSSSR